MTGMEFVGGEHERASLVRNRNCNPSHHAWDEAMNRPLYETQQDRLAEARVAKKVADKWALRPIKLRPTYVVDYALMKENTCAGFMEVKCRNYTMSEMDKMGGFMISLDKLAKGIQLARIGRVVFTIAVSAKGVIYYYDIKDNNILNCHDGLSFGGRTDRDDPQDVEPAALFKAARFQKL